MKAIHRLAAAAIRTHLWKPIQPDPLEGRPWTMGRELQIFDRLARQHDPLELVGAIAHIRGCCGTPGPIRLTWLIRRDRGAALLSRSIAAFRAADYSPAPQARAPRGGGFARISVGLPSPNLSEK